MYILPQLRKKKNDASDKQKSQLHRVAEGTQLQGNLTWNTSESFPAECSVVPRGMLSRLQWRHQQTWREERRQETEGSGTQITNSMWGSSECWVSTSLKPVKEPLHIDSISPSPSSSHTNTIAPSSFYFHLENRSLHPQDGARLTPLHSGVAEVSLGRCELSTQSSTEEGDPRLTGSLEQSLEHWVSQGGWG